VTTLERCIALEGCFNFRDLGGYETADGRRVRWRRLFRADGLHRLTDDDHVRLSDVSLATVIDLRTHDEVQERGHFQATAGDVGRHHLPMLDVLPPNEEIPAWVDPAFVARRYLEMLEAGADAMAEVLALLTDPSVYPAVFHCAAGRDRTGIVAAVVLGLLGVPDDVIVADYTLSRDAMARMIDWWRAQAPDNVEEIDRRAAGVLTVAGESMAGLLAGVRDRHGSLEGYADAIGVGTAPAYLRAALLEG
jgi:protein-tyrosine phosphatase